MFMGRLLRIGGIIAVTAAILFFGLHFGPPRQHRAEAKIFERLLLLTKDMPEYLFDGRTTSEPRRVMVNGNSTYLRVGRTGDNVRAVLDFYARQYDPLPVQPVDDEAVNKIQDKETKSCIKRAIRFVECLSGMQHFRLERSDFGFWSGFEFHDAALKIGTEEFVHRMESALSSGKLGKLGIGRAVIAIRQPEQRETMVITLWTDRDFDLNNLNNLNSDTFGDAPGNDIDSVPRYPGNRRIVSIEQENSLTKDSVVIYEGGGSLAANILFYQGRMKQFGWRKDKGFEELARGERKENVLFYTLNRRECTIMLSKDESTGYIITTIIDRTPV